MAQGAIYSLSDTICYENLKSSATNYGHQRFFGAIGWGSFAILTGFLNSLANDDLNRCYTPGFYLMVVLSAFLILNTHHIDMKLSSHKIIDAKPKNLYVSKEFLCFEVCILASGMLTAYTSCYMIWYIENLGGSQLLGGFALSIQCLLGEALFMYFSESLISTFGHWNIVTASFLTFAVRYYGYYMLNNPWFILPLEVLHGITYGLFYSTMTSYAKEIAPAGSEATVQGIFSGTFQGLGTGFGSFVAGTSIDAYGGRISFLIAAIFSTLAALVSSLFSFIVKDSKPVLIEMK
ncbi:major facilitator superfamily domain-containing protein 6-B-like [Uloborus diversus]|uniref:major facilitator superfamily domain-containing protein 6-B-like n=1 Tax=Uloborus diversus TaxID=327109 RepID=UPI00240A7B05|nr:major facilitator superfamily domain-containing protein 6-B-like [Uloborus diversus]